MRVHQLLYISAATRTLSDAELADILAAARSNNARLRVTGVLIHDAGSFIQVLEGAEERVEGLYRKIAVDPRHRRIVVLARQAVVQSSFAEWSMGFVDRAHPSLSCSERPGIARVALLGTVLGRLP